MRKKKTLERNGFAGLPKKPALLGKRLFAKARYN